MKATSIALYFCLASLALAATGDIVSVAVRADGWSADITIEGKTTGGTYDFGLGTNNDPAAGTPKVVFTVVSKGFDATGAATTITRTIYGTKQVRKPYPNEATNDESVSGGNVTVRVALSDYVYQKDNTGSGNSGTAPTVSILSGFYTQSGGNNASGAGFAVTNNSTCAYQPPVANWSMVPYQRITGNFDLRAVGFHHGAKDGKPLACMIFTATDGTTTLTQTVTGMTIDSDMSADATPTAEYVATLNPTTLTQGAVITANFTAYPWVGDVTATTVGGTAAPTPLAGPLPLLNDRTGGYGVTYAVVDGTGGTDPAVGSDSGKWIGNGSDPGAGSGVTAYATIGRAARAIRDYNNTNRSRDDVGAGMIFVKAGNYAWLGYTTTYGSVPSTWVTVQPFNGVARADVVIASTSGNTDISDRVRLYNVTITSATNNTFGGILAQWVDGCEINSTGTAIFNTSTGVGWFTHNKLTQLTQGLRPSSSGTNWTPALIRGNSMEGFNRASLCYTVIGNANRQKTTWANTVFIGRLSTTAQPKGPIIIYNNDMRGWKATASTQMLVMGDLGESISEVAVVQNLLESTTDASAGIGTFGASESTTTNAPISNILFWHNVMVGQRMQFAYNTSGGIAKERKFWSVKGNYWDVKGYKTDTHTDPGANGAHIGNWPVGFGVGHSGNLSASVTAITSPFLHDFIGIASMERTSGQATPATYAAFANRQSHAGGGTEASGMGDYNLTETSPLVDLMTERVLPFDLGGTARQADNNQTGVYVYNTAASDAPPVVTITSPTSGSSTTSPATLIGTATDDEDGDISASIVWTSNLDGSIGTGASIVAGLSTGVHTITATATDSATQQDTDAITLTITAPPAGVTGTANTGTVTTIIVQ